MALDPSAIGAVTEPQLYEWTERDTLLYALGVGAGTDDLSYTTENSHDIAQQVLPTGNYHGTVHDHRVDVSGTGREQDLLRRTPCSSAAVEPDGHQVGTPADGEAAAIIPAQALVTGGCRQQLIGPETASLQRAQALMHLQGACLLDQVSDNLLVGPQGQR